MLILQWRVFNFELASKHCEMVINTRNTQLVRKELWGERFQSNFWNDISVCRY